MTSRLDNPPHYKPKLVFRSENYSTTPRSLWRNNTHLLLPAGLTKPGYCHCKRFFSCVSTQEHRNRNVCEKVPVRKRQFFFCLWQCSLPHRCATSHREGVCVPGSWQQPPWRAQSHHDSFSPAPPELGQAGFKSISTGRNKRAGTGVQFTVP